MIEIRFHGRGGQGAVTSAELTALAAIEQGKYAQAFPSFGPERRGAPVMAFVRVSEEPIRTREKIYEPHTAVILDRTLLGTVNVAAGLNEYGVVVLNTTKSPEEIRHRSGITAKLALVDASRIAMETMGIPITNARLMGAMLKATDLLPLSAVEGPLHERFGRIAEKNMQASQRAYQETVVKE